MTSEYEKKIADAVKAKVESGEYADNELTRALQDPANMTMNPDGTVIVRVVMNGREALPKKKRRHRGHEA